MMRLTVRVNSLLEITSTKLVVLGQLGEVSVCVAYDVEGDGTE